MGERVFVVGRNVQNTRDGGLFACCRLLFGACALPLTPKAADVEGLEWGRTAPPGNPTRIPGQYVVEFGPEVGIRNLVCEPGPADLYTCRYEMRIKEFGEDFGAWQTRRERLGKTRHGGWCIANESDECV